MSTTPTNLPVPSESPRDLKFNAGKIDEFVTSLAQQYIDRFGHAHYTIEGLKQLTLQQIYNLGWNLAGSFQDGGTVTSAGDLLQDESTNIWYRWDDLETLPKTVPPGSTPDSSGGTGDGKWQAVDVADVLRKDLAKPTGASLSGHFQSTVRQHLIESAHITDFGGGIGVTAAVNASALAAAKSAVGGGKIIFPQPGVYDFPIGTDLTGFIMSPVDGVVIRGPATGTMAGPGIVTDNDFRVYFNAGDPKDYYIDIRKNYHVGSKGANKSLWLNTDDITDSRPLAIDASTILVKQINLGLSDTFINVSPAGRSASSLFLQPPLGGNTQLGVIPAVPGTELKVGVNNIPNNDGEIAVGVIATGGYMVLRGYPSTGSWSRSIKFAGQPVEDVPVNPDGGGTATYSASNNIITVRSISPIRAQILINGLNFVEFSVPEFAGTIQFLGVGATSISSVSGSNFTGWYKQSFKVGTAPRSQSIGIIGDSISDGAIHGAWPAWAAEALDGSLGIRINSIENRAISGQTLDQQISNLADNPFVNASVVVIFIGTNDIQGGNTLSAFQTSLNSLLDTLGSQGRAQVLVIPPQWYLKSDTPNGSGGSSTNSNRGGDIRSAIGRIAAERGLQLVDLTCVTGPVNPHYLTSSFADSVIRDNVHPTAYAYRFFGYEIARAIAAQLCPVIQLPSDWVTFTTFSTGVSGTAQYRYTKEGIEFKGKLEAATALNGTIFTIPEGIRPSVARGFIQWGNTGSIPIVFNADGTVIVHNNSSSTQVSLDGLVLSN